ncbi:unnamed protein product [Paramecium sonneborni]|uniref:Uncharacterized protein n=1 Tax=Paramecium sonneborni TaxID=65129 RepID=A0A8S1KCV4_9CILI|nr:unnamed protein product [Paramecium sonneborni]
MNKLKYGMSVFNRDYFMYIDHKGFLYLEETEPKNFTSCIKDVRFFQFFYKNLTKNKTGRHNDYRFVSKCWGEFNFVKTQSTPIIYNDIQFIENSWKIIAQNGYSEAFEANLLFIKDNLLYYKVSLNDLEFGILSTDLAIKLGENINEYNTFKWENNIYQL